MKNKTVFKSLFTGIAILTLTTGLISCKKNDVDESGSANLKVVNASPSSTPQGFYLANSTVVQGGLVYGNNRDYIATNSGSNLEAQFRNEGSTAPYGVGKFSLDQGNYYTVFLAGDGQAARVKLFKDDMAAPAAGKAKVRFIHLSDAAPENIDIKRLAGDNLVVNLKRDASSNYIAIDPGLLSLQVFATGQSSGLAQFDVSSFVDGKIYTVYITGSTAADIEVQKLTHN